MTALLAVAFVWACSGDAPPEAAGGKAGKDKGKGKEAAAEKAAAPAEAAPDPKLLADYIYDPTNKRDPFRSFVKGIYDNDAGDDQTTPLERFDLSQLDLAAIIWGIDAPRALIVDPSGKGYIVGTGAVLGKNKGRIISIGDNLVVVKETYIDSFDRATTKPVELRLRTTEGG